MKNEITNTRLFDLVRFMRSELHQAELITDEEYVWLCADAPLATCKEGGSPSPRRLEDYDDMRVALNRCAEQAQFIVDNHEALKRPGAELQKRAITIRDLAEGRAITSP